MGVGTREDRHMKDVSKELNVSAEPVAEVIEMTPRTDADAPRQLVATQASRIPTRKTYWLIDDVVRLGVPNILAGFGGLGKSLWFCHVTALLTRGKFERHGSGSAVICSTEDAWDTTLVPRLKAAGADLDRVFHVGIDGNEDPDDPSLSGLEFPKDIGALEDLIEDIGDVKLLILDPLEAFLTDLTTGFSNAEVRRAIRPVAELAKNTGVAVLCIAHFNKGGGQTGYERLTGSSAYYNAARVLLLFGSEDGATTMSDKRFLVVEKNNDGNSGQAFSYLQELASVQADNGEMISSMKLRYLGAADIESSVLFRGQKEPSVREQVKEAYADVVQGWSWAPRRKIKEQIIQAIADEPRSLDQYLGTARQVHGWESHQAKGIAHTWIDHLPGYDWDSITTQDVEAWPHRPDSLPPDGDQGVLL